MWEVISLSVLWAYKKASFTYQEEDPSWNQTGQTLEMWKQTNKQKLLLSKPPILWYFVLGALVSNNYHSLNLVSGWKTTGTQFKQYC